MRRAHLLVPVVVLLALWFFTRRMDGQVDPLGAPRGIVPVDVAEAIPLEVDGRGGRGELPRVAVSDDEVHASSEPSAPDAVRLRLARHSSFRGTTTRLGRVVAWATGGDRRGVEVVVTGVNAADWTEAVVSPPAGGADRVHAVWDEPGWTSSVETATVRPDELIYLQLMPRPGACVVGELVDARGRAERSGEMSLVRRGDGNHRGRTSEHVADGRFRLNFSERGTYDLYARGSGGQARHVLELDPDRPPTALLVVLQGAGRLRGRVLDARGEGLASWPLVAAMEGELFERLRAPEPRPSLAEDDDAAPGRTWTDTVSALDGTFDLSGLRTDAFGIASGPAARAARGVVLATGLVPSVDGLELRLPVAWTTVEVTDERGRRLRFDPHERPGQPVKPGTRETDVYVVLEQAEGLYLRGLSTRVWQGSGTWDLPRWSVLVEAGAALRATVWASDRRLAVVELAATSTPPATWTLRAAPVTETAWLRIRPTGITATERDQLGFVVVDLASGHQVDRDVFDGEESVEVGIPPGRYQVLIRPIEPPRYAYVPMPARWSGQVTLAPGEERTLEVAPVSRGRLELSRHFGSTGSSRLEDLVREFAGAESLEVHLTPAPGIVGGESTTFSLLSGHSIDLAPGTWTLRANSQAGHSAHAVLEIEAGKVTRHDLEVSIPR